ncbi:MAG: beta strand repeat-containing protein [Planctomycetaceae bacterium]
MKPTRFFATASLVLSSLALITAANISVGDEGVVRMSSLRPQEGTSPAPAAGGTGQAQLPPAPSPGPAPVETAPAPGGGIYPQPQGFAPYFERTVGATEMVPGVYQPERPFGPILMFETNLGGGVGYTDGSQRINARMPYHIVPNMMVMLGDVSGGVTWDGKPYVSGGGIYRYFDPTRNRVFGMNMFFDYDEGLGFGNQTRTTVGVESLGQYVDFRANAYVMVGDDTTLLSTTLLPNIALAGNNVFRQHEEVRANAYSGGDFELGGPLPLLGRYGMNMYPGMYYLTNDSGHDALGFQVRWEALVTQNLTVNTTLAHDGTFDTNTFVGIQYEIPNYRQQRTFRPRMTRERLMDPVVRSNRIQQRIDTIVKNDAIINAQSGNPWNIVYVDPNLGVPGIGTLESPYNSMQLAKLNNNAGVDIIRIAPRQDDSGTNLTLNGGISLFDDQVLLSSLLPFQLEPGAVIPADVNPNPPLAPLLSDPVMVAGGSVVRLANNNQILGLRIDGANAAGTVFGNGVSNALPITGVTLADNEFTRYADGARLSNVSGRISITDNLFDGLLGASQDGLDLSIAGGTNASLLVDGNTADDNSGVGLKITALDGSRVNADNPDAAVPTGIVNNTADGNGTGIRVEARNGAVMNAVVDGNTAGDNTADGLQMISDNATFNLASLSGNTLSNNIGNGTFIHYRNGGIFRSVSEDANGNGTLDAGEDANGNGRLDFGIVSNVMNSNQIAGICIFGEDASTGVFDVGGPSVDLANTFIGNGEGGLLTDLEDTATAQMDVLFNNIQGGNANPGLTIVLDFIDPAQGSVVDANGRTVGPFGLAAYGFAPSQYDTVTRAILATVQNHYKNLPTSADSPLSTIPPLHELNLDFVIGDTGTAPSNGATEYYVVTIGDSPTAPPGLAGEAGDIGNIRNKAGQGPGLGLGAAPLANGGSAMGVYTNNIVSFSPFLTPPNAFGATDGIYVDPANSADYAIKALTSGDLNFTRKAIGLITSHELGHTLSLRHIENGTAIVPGGVNAIMATPAIDLSIQALVEDAALALQGNNPGEQPGEAPFVQNDISQLAAAIGTRLAAGETRNGIRVRGSDSARLLPSTFINNTVTGAKENGIAVLMNDSAVAESVTIQGNQITAGEGSGIVLAADGMNARIDADQTIGGIGSNVFRGNSFARGNLISGMEGDGFRALAANGAVIEGNLINNTITGNSGNGAALLVENGGRLDFGTPASNRVIRGNTITANGGAGLLLNQQTSPGRLARIDADVLGNTISGNDGGGIVSALFGNNNLPPALPLLTNNNILDLQIGGTALTDNNVITANSEVGIGVNVTGNGNALVNLTDVTVTGTTNSAGGQFNGDGISFRRDGSSLLTANLTRVFSTGNEGDGLVVSTFGNDKTDLNQPLSGTANIVTVRDSSFGGNGRSGASFTTRGDSTLIADIFNSTFSNNTLDGIQVTTAENSSFGDPAAGLPPGRRSVFSGLVVTDNRRDGIQINVTEESRALVEITSAPSTATGTPHAAASALGSTSIANNGRDGIRIDSTGGRTDVLVTSTPGSTTTISGNGVSGGGNGIRWNASGNSAGTVRVTKTDIRGSIRGASEDVNNDGVLTPAEDLNNNADIDIADGDGIQANFSNTTNAQLIVGNAGEGNRIQNNQDDGIAITATGNFLNDIPRPIIAITDNLIGGNFNGISAGNGGDGVSLNIFGGTAVGIPTASVDFTAPGLSPNGGVTEIGPIPTFTMTNNVVSNNADRGVNLLLTGAAGVRDRSTGVFDFDPVRINLNQNVIDANGSEGVFYRADSDMNQSKFVYLGNAGFPGDNRLAPFWDPGLPQFTSLNAGSINGNTMYMEPYLNLESVQNSLFIATGNTIRNNGFGGVTGEGIRIEVGTGSYVAADLRNNTFGGNLEADFASSSFLSAGNTFDSANTSGANTFDYIYLDDIAQMDLRFQNNTGNQIAPSDVGAIYTNPDLLKASVLGIVGVTRRDASFFQVDNGPALNSPNNIFNNYAATQNIQSAFTNGNYNIRSFGDPAWPNPGFTPFLP